MTTTNQFLDIKPGEMQQTRINMPKPNVLMTFTQSHPATWVLPYLQGINDRMVI